MTPRSMFPPRLLVAWLVAVVLVAAVATVPQPLAAQEPPAVTFTGYVPRTGVSWLVVNEGASPAQIAQALAPFGCIAQSLALTARGDFLAYVVGAPEFVNTTFPGFLSPGTTIGVRCEPAATSVTATEVLRFTPARPPDATGQDGSCFTSSAAVAARPDAWRCMVGNQIHDPCFELPDSAIVCGADPTTGAAGFLLQLTQPLPPAPRPQASVIASAQRNGWRVLLEDGTVCGLNTGATGGINGERLNYGCPAGRWILGDLITGTPWTAVVVTVSSGTNGFRLDTGREIVIRTVWQ